jgi:3-oxoisoapionate decarboxylase
VQPDRRGISQVVEHWLPWQGDSLTTVNTEDQWTLHNLDYLRRKQA